MYFVVYLVSNPSKCAVQLTPCLLLIRVHVGRWRHRAWSSGDGGGGLGPSGHSMIHRTNATEPADDIVSSLADCSRSRLLISELADGAVVGFAVSVGYRTSIRVSSSMTSAYWPRHRLATQTTWFESRVDAYSLLSVSQAASACLFIVETSGEFVDRNHQ